MEWTQWIKSVIDYKEQARNINQKYIDFETWRKGLESNRTIIVDNIKNDLIALVNENFNDQEQIGESYLCVQKLLGEFSEYLIEKDSSRYNDLVNSIKKVVDFIDNEVYSRINDIEGSSGDTVSDSYKAEIQRLTKSVLSLKGKIKDCEDEIKNNTTSVVITNVEILGIFIAIAFALFGIFNLTVNAISIAGVSISRLLFIISSLTFIMFNSVFLLLYAISRFIDKSIAMNCSKAESADIPCQKCKNRRRLKWLCKLQHKFTYLLIVNIVCVLGVIVAAVFYFV